VYILRFKQLQELSRFFCGMGFEQYNIGFYRQYLLDGALLFQDIPYLRGVLVVVGQAGKVMV
jgi:hypothetical protein